MLRLAASADKQSRPVSMVKQRQQNDDRDRDSEQPEQYAASHAVLLSLPHEMAEVEVLIPMSSTESRRGPSRRRSDSQRGGGQESEINANLARLVRVGFHLRRDGAHAFSRRGWRETCIRCDYVREVRFVVVRETSAGILSHQPRNEADSA